MLQPPEHARAREAILTFGVYGSGKSEGWAAIGETYRMTDTPGHFHVLSTEWERALQIAEGCQTDFYANSTIHEVTDYESLMAASEAIRKVNAESDNPLGDWIIIDSIGTTLQWTRDVWFQNEMKMTFREFMGSGKKLTEVGPAGWIQMDTMYKDWILPHVLRFPGHSYACAQADTVNMEGAWADKGAIKDLFGRIGLKPVGEKNNPYLFGSILLTLNPSKGEYCLTTVKDRKGREYLTREPLAMLPLGFAQTYLVGVAGWSL